MKEKTKSISIIAIAIIMFVASAILFTFSYVNKEEKASADIVTQNELQIQIEMPTVTTLYSGIIYMPTHRYQINYNYPSGNYVIYEINNGPELNILLTQKAIGDSTTTVNIQIEYISYNLTTGETGNTNNINWNIVSMRNIINQNNDLEGRIIGMLYNQIPNGQTNAGQISCTWCISSEQGGGTNLPLIIINSGTTLAYKAYWYTNGNFYHKRTISGTEVDTQRIYQVGFNDGYENAYNELFQPRYDAGFAAGEISGATNANNYSFIGLLNAVMYAPLKAFTSMLNFEILGFNMLSLATALLSISAVIGIIKVIL